MTLGTFYGIGVGPGDPGWITVQGRELLSRCRNVFVPKARIKADSIALGIARRYLAEDSRVEEVIFPMVEDPEVLERHWRESAGKIAKLLRAGEDACFLTLGDTLLYSTHIYLLRALKAILPDLEVCTVPGVTAFSAVAALTNFPVGEGKKPVTILPASDDLDQIRKALALGGTVILMKVGKRIGRVLDVLEEHEVIDHAVFVARAGMQDERIETDLKRLRSADPQLGYLATILVNAERGRNP